MSVLCRGERGFYTASMNRETILITGAEGQLGSELNRQLSAFQACSLQPTACSLSHRDCDLSDAEQLARVFEQRRPSTVINTAAYTAVDRAEQEPALCHAINAGGVETLARLCNEFDCRLVQISTDYVFGSDSQRSTPYLETDEPGPVSEYGRSKLAGEQAAARATRHLIVRTCGLYGRLTTPRQANFVATMLRLAKQHDRLRIVNDQWCTPSNVAHVAGAILALLDADAQGLVHVVNRGATTWCEFAAEIFRLTNARVAIDPISTAEYNAPARRPAYSVLDTTRLGERTGHELPTWQAALAEHVQTLAGP